MGNRSKNNERNISTQTGNIMINDNDTGNKMLNLKIKLN